MANEYMAEFIPLEQLGSELCAIYPTGDVTTVLIRIEVPRVRAGVPLSQGERDAVLSDHGYHRAGHWRDYVEGNSEAPVRRSPPLEVVE